MAVLRVLKGSCPGQLIELTGDRLILGRHPQCKIVLDNVAVSRHHAQILQNNGSFYLEDLRSRNGTYLNGHRLEGRTPLHEGDLVKVCDVVFSFHRGVPPDWTPPSDEGEHQAPDQFQGTGTLPPTSGPARGIPSVVDSSSSAILGKVSLQGTDQFRLMVKPESKLRAILEISRSLTRTLQVDQLLPKILDTLFRIFPQADRGFVLLKDPESGNLAVKGMKVRREDLATGSISMTIVKKALESGEAILTTDAIGDSRFSHSDSIVSLQLRSIMCVPMISQEGEGLGVVQLDLSDMRYQFSQEDLDLLACITHLISITVDNAHLHEVIVKRRELERELEFATQVQLGFLPKKRPQVPGYDFFDFYEAALRVGGDFFDYVQLPDGRLVVAVGDVAGKGIPAALLMARLYSLVRYQLLENTDLSLALTALNDALGTGSPGYRFVTMCLAILNPSTNTVTLGSAGHPPPIIRKLDGQSVPAPIESGFPLGILPGGNYKTTSVTLKPDEMLVFYTDGVTEAMNTKNEIFGIERLRKFMAKSHESLEQLGEDLVADIVRFSDGRAQSDDICLVGLHHLSTS